MKANIARKEASEEKPAAVEDKKLATWGTDVPGELTVGQKKLDEALEKEDEGRREEKDERKRKHNVRWNDDVIYLFILPSLALVWGPKFYMFVHEAVFVCIKQTLLGSDTCEQARALCFCKREGSVPELLKEV